MHGCRSGRGRRTAYQPKRRILVVGDEPEIRALLRLVLSRAGFQVDGAADGAEALDRFREQRYVVVLLDLKMPRMNGYELIERLRDLPDRPPVVVLTAVSDASVRNLDPAVVNEVLRKPFEADTISSTVTAIIEAIERRKAPNRHRLRPQAPGASGRAAGRS